MFSLQSATVTTTGISKSNRKQVWMNRRRGLNSQILSQAETEEKK